MRENQINRTTLAVLLGAALVLASPGAAQVLDGVPHLINYQGRLTDSGGNPVADGEYIVQFTIWSDSISTASPDREWISPNCTSLVVNGLFNWQLGSRENLPPWTMNNYADLWLGIQVESDPEITPRTRLCSAPYAYKAWQADYAEYADSAGVVVSGAGGWIDDGDVVHLDAPSDSVGIGTSSPGEKLEVVGTTQMTGFKMPTAAVDGHVLTSDGDGNGTWQAPGPGSGCGESGEFDGVVNTDLVELDPGGTTTFNFGSAFTSTAKPYMIIAVVLKQAANGLVEGAAIKAVVDIKGSAGNWTGFDITVSKLSDGSSITDNAKVYVTWMAIRP